MKQGNKMKEIEFRKYVECIIDMCTNYLLGKLSQKTLLSNLTLMLKKIEQEENEDSTS